MKPYLKFVTATKLLALTTTIAMASPLNVVFVTFDDLSRSSIGVHGCEVENITPHMDSLAKAGLRFEYAHVQASNCTPSRNLMMTGKYQQNNRVFSLGKTGAGNTDPNLATMTTVFNDAGYHTGIMGKNPHHNPFHPYTAWDVEYDSYGSTRDPQNIYQKTQLAIADANNKGKPLFFNLNIYDPHTEWYGWDPHTGPVKEKENHPSRIYGPDEVPYPDFFPKISRSALTGMTKGSKKSRNKKASQKAPVKPQRLNMMLEVAAYYNSVKRSDDSLGMMLKAFKEADMMNNTIFVLFSDHGVQLPGGKTTLYNEGTLSPLFVVWPGVTKPDTVNDKHFVSSIDLLPTFAEIAGQPIPADLDGQSLVPIIKGETQAENWRDYVYLQQNDRNKSRGVKNKKFLYIINPWANGTQKFGSVSTGMFTWKLFKDAEMSPETPEITRDWIKRIEYRAAEELYDVVKDPHCLINLASNPDYADQKEQMRQLMEQEVVASNDYFVNELVKDPSDLKLMQQMVQKVVKEVAAQQVDPKYLREVNFDPFDGNTIIDHTIFEPFGEWGIWKSDTQGAVLAKKAGNKAYGLSAIQLKSQGAGVARVITSRPIDTSVYQSLKIDLSSITNQVNRGTTLRVVYRDGDTWKVLSKVTAGKIRGDHHFELFQGKKMPAKLVLGIEAEFNSTGGTISIPTIRLSGKQAWRDVPVVSSEVKLNGEKAIKEITSSIDASSFAHLELRYAFSSDNFSAGDRLFSEYFDGKQWLELETHDYGYVLNPSTQYSVVSELKGKALKAGLKIRLRSQTSNAGKAITIQNIQLRARQAENSGD